MNFGEAKAALKALINRKDITDSLAAMFINQTISDLEHNLRLGFMERLLPVYMDGVSDAVRIPRDYLELMSMFNDQGHLNQLDAGRFVTRCREGEYATSFLKVADRWMLRPVPAAGAMIFLQYYAQTEPLTADTQTSVWLLSCFNAVLYGAAEFAADFFEDERAPRFQAKYQQFRASLEQQALDETFSGPLSIQPVYAGDY